MAEIVFDHVTKVFQEQIALEDISFQIEKARVCFCDRKKRRGEKYIVRIADKAAGTDSRKRFCISESFGGVKGERDSSL